MATLEVKNSVGRSSVTTAQVTSVDGQTITIPTGVSSDEAASLDKGCAHAVNAAIYPAYPLGDFDPMAFARQVENTGKKAA